MDYKDDKYLLPSDVRKLIRENKLDKPTAGICPTYIQSNLVVLTKKYALEFKEFIEKNPKPCPLLEIIDNGTPISSKMALGSNVLTDIPYYRVYKDGVLEGEYRKADNLWQPDMTAFLIGCSLTFEDALVKAGIRLKHFEENKRVPMFDTNIECNGTNLFKGNYVVSMRPIKKELIDLAIKITEKMDFAHGAPVHIGNPVEIGIKDITKPDYGDSLSINSDEVPVFWACGVTPQAVARQAKPDLMITHSPGYMLITDIKCSEI